VLKSLLVDDYVVLEVIEKKLIELTEEGQSYAKDGSPEFQFVSKMQMGEKCDMAEMENRCGKQIAKVGFGKAMKQKWIKKDGNDFVRIVADIKDEDQTKLQGFLANPVLEAHDKKDVDNYKKRKHLNVKSVKSYKVTKGGNFATQRTKMETELTAEMLRTGAWKDQAFKKLNFEAEGIAGTGGHLHPLLLVREQFREIFLEMGFTEMPTDRYAESSFWNFDALFQPQSHPARDMHDTFFLKNPAKALTMPPEYMEAVKKIHSTGGFGSKGYGYDWQEDEARKNLLRTHTTAVSSQMLYKLAQQKEFKPTKYFSIDRVFRNETLDATHLAEFHQCEGLIADRGIGLSHLMGIISEFYKKIGIKKIKYKPAYNPYTEPSLEVFGYHPDLKRWVEIGNSGVFRPEMLRPMGLPEDVNVIAWGLSLERPTMIHYNLSNIRDLFGHKVALSSTKNNKICYIVPN
jgi:phenylalanyl-tRNA synthetase alpha chain